MLGFDLSISLYGKKNWCFVWKYGKWVYICKAKWGVCIEGATLIQLFKI